MSGRRFCIALPLICAASLFAQDGTVARDGFALHYRSEGSGTPIVFLAGGPGLEVDYFVPAAELFPAGYRRIYLEQRGTGRSRPARLTPEMMTLRLVVEDLEALRTHLHLDRIMDAALRATDTAEEVNPGWIEYALEPATIVAAEEQTGFTDPGTSEARENGERTRREIRDCVISSIKPHRPHGEAIYFQAGRPRESKGRGVRALHRARGMTRASWQARVTVK